MKKFIFCILSFILLPYVPQINAAERKSVGLVLSGGGAKGIAHAGVIQALEENGIPIDYVAGTSMGAIVGGLYASGYSPQEIIDVILSKEFTNWSTGKIDPSLTYYYLKPESTPAIMKFDIGKDATAKSILPSSFINPIPMNFGFMEIFTPHTAVCGGDFNNLFVPFRCVASDVYNKRKVVLADGDLGQAIRMSMTFPVAFKPIEKDSLPMFDGGIYDNFPVDVMKDEFAPDVIVGVDVSTHEKEDVTSLISQLERMIIQQDDYTLEEKDGIKIHVDLRGVGLLDFPRANEIFTKGYKTALSLIDSIRNRTGQTVTQTNVNLRRNIYKSKVPEVRFDTVSISGAGKRAENYIRHIFMKKNDTISIAKAKDAYYRTITSEKYRDLLPTPKYDKKDGLFELQLKASPKNNFGIGIGGFITSSTNSMAFLSAEYSTLALNSFTGEIMGWIGQSYYGGLFNGRISIHSGIPTTLKIQAVASRQKYYEDDVLFFENDSPTFVTMGQYYGNFILGLGIGRHSKLEAKVGYGYLCDKFYPNRNVDFATTERDEACYNLVKAGLTYDYNTLDNAIYPSAGLRLMANVSGIVGNKRYINGSVPELSTVRSNVKWIEAELDIRKYFELSRKFKIGVRLDAIASTKKLYDSYTATIIQAPAFSPTQVSKGSFVPSLRSNSFVAGGVIPIFNIIDNLQLRTEFYAFSPIRQIRSDINGKPFYGDWFGSLDFMGEASVVYNFPFASLSLYGNYVNYPASKWNIGICFGVYITAPKFLR